MFDKQEFTRHVAWFRYLYAAQVLKEQFEVSLDLPEVKGFVYWPSPASWVWLNYYYGSLYVVIEAWQKLKLRAPLVDLLLEHQHGIILLMKRFRNGVFHFQKELESPKLAEFLRTGGKHVFLVKLLHDSFVRYWEWLNNLPSTEAQQKELREHVAAFVGWIPHTVEDTEREMRADLEQFKKELLSSDLTEEQRTRAMEIKRSLEEFPNIAQAAKTGLDSLREQMIGLAFDFDTTGPSMNSWAKNRA